MLARVVAAAMLVVVTEAHAFPTSSAVSEACHETITMEALREARIQSAAGRPLAPATRDDRAFIDDLPFDVDADMRDLGAVTLLTGVRYNDLRGRGPNEVDSLAQIHGDPTTQSAHCLRGPDADQPTGTETALRECRSFIRGKILDALGGLDAAGIPDRNARVTMEVDLSLRGGVDASLPRFYARMGEALHAVQDGFSHTYRAGDRTRVTVVLNYVELVEKDLDPTRDGPAHSRELDRCDNADEVRTRNRTLAWLASSELLAATLDTSLSRDQKMTAVDGILDRYFTYQPGCDASNGWCDAPEARYADDSGCGCAVLGIRRGDVWLALAAVAFVLVVRRCRRRTAIASILAAAASESVAHAQDDLTAAQKEEKHSSSPVALYAAGAGSFSNPAFAGIVGARFRLNDRWVAGLDGELNGWYGVHSGRLRMGATNVYGTLIVRFPLRFEDVNLRSALQLGTAIQMVDLHGVPKGSVGIFAGLQPLGIEWKLSGHVYAIVYPLGIALPVTQLTGAPFAYPQYRTTLGLELAL